nr:type I toxin-antitoxin system SymE family toxin [Yersinia aldovae]
MNITFTPEPIPELTLAVGTLAALGFTTGTPLQLTRQHHTLWITVVTAEAT